VAVSSEKENALREKMAGLGIYERDLKEQFVRSGGQGRAKRKQNGDLCHFEA